MKYLLPIFVFGCETLDCEYPKPELGEALPENTEVITCQADYENGCAPDTAYCRGKYMHASELDPSYTVTHYVYWIRHLDEEIPCAGYLDCEEVYEMINNWCNEYQECWRADRLPELENCNAANC